jgi:hypothetical protein
MKFTELLKEIAATYPEQPRSFHVLATRFYIGAETLESLKSMAEPLPATNYFQIPPILSHAQVQAIIDNR